MPDTEPVERRWKVLDPDLDDPRSEPTCLEPSVAGERKSDRRESTEGDEHPGTLETLGAPEYAQCMGWGARGATRSSWVVVSIGAIAGLVVLQSVVHLVLVLDLHRIDTVVDLDRSNGIPDILSTLAFAVAAAGAVVLARSEDGRGLLGSALAAGLVLLGAADLIHWGAHPTPTSGKVVIALVGGVGVLAVLIAVDSAVRTRVTLAGAGCVLVCSFAVITLDRFFHRFERERGDAIAEYQIVAKEGLELLGWSLVALALWDEALRRRRAHESGVTAPASPAPARPTRRAA
jgi:hypothetical protein